MKSPARPIFAPSARAWLCIALLASLVAIPLAAEDALAKRKKSSSSTSKSSRKLGYTPPSPSEIDAILHNSATLNGNAKLEARTKILVGARYELSPLGEGSGNLPDEDPTLRYDSFDCTTFVETALAMVRAQSETDILPELNKIRYQDGNISYETRRHFPESEWLPQLENLGYLRDITADVAGPRVQTASKTLTLDDWKNRKKAKNLVLPDERIPTGTFTLPIFPIEDAIKYSEKIPAGVVISIVKESEDGIPIMVSHLALTVEKNGKVYARNATESKNHTVADESVRDFLKRITKAKKWRTIGVNIKQIVIE